MLTDPLAPLPSGRVYGHSEGPPPVLLLAPLLDRHLGPEQGAGGPAAAAGVPLLAPAQGGWGSLGRKEL